MLLFLALLLSTLQFATAAPRAQSNAKDLLVPVKRRQPGPASFECTTNTKGHIQACSAKLKDSAILDFKPLFNDIDAPGALYCVSCGRKWKTFNFCRGRFTDTDTKEELKGQIVCKEVVKDCQDGTSFGPFAHTYKAYACGDQYPNYQGDFCFKFRLLLADKKFRCLA